jgi:hypothetical protein
MAVQRLVFRLRFAIDFGRIGLNRRLAG